MRGRHGSRFDDVIGQNDLVGDIPDVEAEGVGGLREGLDQSSPMRGCDRKGDFLGGRGGGEA